MIRRSGITIIEVLVVIVVIVVAAALLLPSLSTGRREHREFQNNTQIGGIHTGLVIYSQANKTFYVGRKADGSLADSADVATRMSTLIQDNFFTTEYAQSPSEPTPPVAGYSYDMVGLADTTGQRFDGWRNTDNAKTPMVSDRLFSGTPGQPTNYRSIYTPTPGDWRGSVGYNDNHVDFETKAILLTNDGKHYHTQDDLFFAESADDALMVYSGT